MTPHRSAVSSPDTIFFIVTSEYNSDNGAFLSTPTGNLDQAFTYFAVLAGSPLRTGNFPSGAIERVAVYPSFIEYLTNSVATSVFASVVTPKYLISAQAAPAGLEGPPKVVTIPVFCAKALEVGSSFIVGGAEFLNPANSSRIKGDHIIIAALPAKYIARDCFQ